MPVIGEVPKEAVAVKLHRITKGDRLLACEMVGFVRGSVGVELVLRRASDSGLVHVGGKIEDYFADLHSKEGDLIETVALDRSTYNRLKNHWMRCKLLQEDGR